MADSFSDAGLTSRIVAIVDALDYGSLPPSAQRELVRALVNAIGCTIGGADHPLVDVAYEALFEFFGPPTSVLLGRGVRADGLSAALLNALSGAAYSFDDTYSNAMLHPAGPIASALIVIAQRQQIDGATFLSAFAAGLEFACRLTKAIALEPAEGEMGWSQTGVVCAMAAALASGRLLKLDQRALASALGIAASQASGTRSTHGSMAASLIFGNAAQNGLRAALLAARGFTGPDTALEDRFGILALFSRKACQESMIVGFGVDFELLHLTYKPFPCGMVIHPVLDAVLQLRKAYDITGPNVERVLAHVSSQAIKFGWHPAPRNSLEAKVSLHHWIAVGLQTGRAGLAEGRMEMVEDAEVLALRERIELAEDEALATDAARVAVITVDGARHELAVDHCVGSAEQPMSDEQISRKFMQQVGPIISETRAALLLEQCWALSQSADVGAIIATGM
ncbi:MmgE/PrpD family protein [Sphingomonas sp. AP4-R1]|uniref:MmgE/PrpD family protein n=1 Tax=Sphingomonas sp. AP4-R1 TaxID=2735134 RepID=UPI001493420C|nr:MmgE/PrpD family protein [Sphingomonas sp. AP4-R1]QJU58152.1 MmgE/PrpD family protein [Sphingomonas sp. AP4-R1]